MKTVSSFNIFFSGMMAVISTALCPAMATAAGEPLALGSRLELFADLHLVDKLEQVEHRLHHPRPATSNHVIFPTRTFLGGYVYGTLIKDTDVYRFYGRRDTSGQPQVTVYAESSDGINWTEPELGLYDTPWVKEGNVVLHEAGHVPHNFSPFLDANPAATPDLRYKALGGSYKKNEDPPMDPGLHAWGSADGIHWKRLQDDSVIPAEFLKAKYGFDSQNVSFWSATENRYLCYFRVFSNQYSPGVRAVRRTTSTDFINWDEPVDVNLNMPWPGTPDSNQRTFEQIYTSNIQPYFRAPHLLISLPTRVDFRKGRDASCDILFATSRDGINFVRSFNDTFFRPGATGKYHNRGHYACYNVVQTGPAEMSLFTFQPRRYTLRLDGFGSLYAGLGGGVASTRTLTFSGSSLVINAETAGIGSVRVALTDADGQTIGGFSENDCIPFIGDAIEHQVSWAGGSNLAQLAGRPLRMHFFLKDADIYAFQFK